PDEEINRRVDELLEKGCIEPSNSTYSSPVIMVMKKTGKWRLCVYYRLLNERSEKNAYPLPRMNHILEQLREAKLISSLDLKNGYWQFFRKELKYLGHMDFGLGAILTQTIGEEDKAHLGEEDDRGISARYFWPGLHGDVRRYVAACELCQRYKPSQLQAAGQMLTQVPEEPCADFVEPLPRSTPGNNMLLVLVGWFSK
ncbi:hypothetical protein KR018_011258, partial [Drosophila ironensis]